MKLVVLAFMMLTACAVNHRSDQYACTKNSDCDSGRVCSNEGFCVVAGSTVDAPKMPTDAPKGDAGMQNNCPPGCTTCNTAQKTCTINCQMTSCSGQVTCPAGYKCEIMCNADGSCRNGINCSQAASCNIQCDSRQSCEGVTCGAGPCSVSCSGSQSCRNVACGNSCACDVLCTGTGTCQQGISCSSFACRSGLGCTSVPALCHSCQ